jgi:hypothetical protein
MAARPSRNLFGVQRVAETRDEKGANLDSWDAYARLLRLYQAGVGPSPSLLVLAAEAEAYYSLAEDRSGLSSGPRRLNSLRARTS